jgi:outer membrane lipoprotein-sorting protein
MRSAFLPLATVILAAAPAPASAQAGSLAAVSAHLKAVTTMTANFTQTDRAGKSVSGVLSLKRPGKIRFQYEKGVPILIVGDGKALTFIDYSVRQVQRWPIGSTPLGVLLNPNRDLTGIAKLLPAANPKITLVEARDKKHPEYGVITLAFSKNDSAPAGLMLEGWVSIDSQNNRTTVRLSNQRFNAPISDKTFIWSDPRPKGPRG